MSALPIGESTLDRMGYLLTYRLQAAMVQTDITGLEQKLNHTYYAWTRMRIKSMWSEWLDAARELQQKDKLKTRTKQKVMINGAYKLNEKKRENI